MVRVKVWLTHTNYGQRILTYYTRILLLDLTYGRTMMVTPAVSKLTAFVSTIPITTVAFIVHRVVEFVDISLCGI